jgi:hypothetical protein
VTLLNSSVTPLNSPETRLPIPLKPPRNRAQFPYASRGFFELFLENRTMQPKKHAWFRSKCSPTSPVATRRGLPQVFQSKGF